MYTHAHAIPVPLLTPTRPFPKPNQTNHRPSTLNLIDNLLYLTQVGTIETQFRTFPLEVLGGDDDLHVTLRESGVRCCIMGMCICAYGLCL